MKKMKKLLAGLLTLSMVMGMSLTSFAQEDQATTDNTTPYVADITVEGLAAGDATTVNVYPLITLNQAENKWEIAQWASDYVTANVNEKGYIVGFTLNKSTTYEELKKAAASGDVAATTRTDATSATFAALPVGAYVILAAGQKAAYNIMVAETYKEDETYMTAVDVLIDAKTSGYEVKKEADDKFVKRGQEVVFTVTTIFPSFIDPDHKDNKYEIIDTPVGLDIKEVTSVKIGGTPVKLAEKDIEETNVDGSTTKYVIDLSDSIGTTNANAGKIVEVEYTATVTSEDGYNNNVGAYRDNVKLGEDDEKGFTGDLTITKKAEGSNEVLKGAQFQIKKDNDVLYFVADGTENVYVEGTEEVDYVVEVYKLALTSTEASATQTLVSNKGYLKIEGLDEGIYTIVETKAPAGYSINENIPNVTVVENNEKDVLVHSDVIDTKLAHLPSTGGIGTTIFTIGGCGIMIAAAYLFFVSRRKEA